MIWQTHLYLNPRNVKSHRSLENFAIRKIRTAPYIYITTISTKFCATVLVKSSLGHSSRPRRRTKRVVSRMPQLASGGILFSVPFSTSRPLTAGPLNPLRNRWWREEEREGRRSDKLRARGKEDGVVVLEATSTPRVVSAKTAVWASRRPLPSPARSLPRPSFQMRSGVRHQETRATMMIISM